MNSLSSTVLRVRLVDPLTSDGLCDWVLCDASGKVLQHRADTYHRWPAATRREVIIAASRVRIASVRLPRMPESRLPAAASFAIEEQLAGPIEAHYLAIGKQREDGSVRIAIVNREWFEALASSVKAAGLAFSRVLAEPDLAPTFEQEWIWCARTPDSPGFVRLPNGASINIGAANASRDDSGDATLPPELSLALQHTAKEIPKAVRVAVPSVSEEQVAQWSTTIPFRVVKPWRWEEASTGSADLIDLQFEHPADANLGSGGIGANRQDGLRALKPAAFIAALALFIHVGATVGEWSLLQLKAGRLNREMAAIAQRAGVEATGNGASTSSLVAARHSELRHQAGLSAPDDFLPMLGRAAPVLPLLPAGTVRTLSYADKHILLDLKPIDAVKLATIQRDLTRLNLPNLAAPAASGPRLRFGTE